MRVSTTGDLGALVRQERQDQGLTQAELAELFNVSRTTIYRELRRTTTTS